jgi:hypothetical protein
MFNFTATVLSSAGETSAVFMQSLSYKLMKTTHKTNYISRKILGFFFQILASIHFLFGVIYNYYEPLILFAELGKCCGYDSRTSNLCDLHY